MSAVSSPRTGFTPAERLHRVAGALLLGALVACLLTALVGGLIPSTGSSGLEWPDGTLRTPGRTPAWFVVSATRRLAVAIPLLLAAGAVSAVVSLATLVAMRSAALRGEVAVRRSVGASLRHVRAVWRREALTLASAATLIAWLVSLMLMWAAGTLEDATLAVRVGLVLASVTPLLAAGLGLLMHVTLGRLVSRRNPSTDVLSGMTRRPRPPALRSVVQIALSVAVAGAALVTARGIASLTVHQGPVAALSVFSGVEPAALAALRSSGSADVRTASVAAPGAHLGLGGAASVITHCGRCWEGGLPMPLFPTAAAHLYVNADTFQYLGVELAEGRFFEPGAQEVVVNRALAGRYFEGGQAIGRMMEVGPSRTWYQVVGVVEGNVTPRAIGAGDQPRPVVYLPVEHFAGPLEVAVQRGATPVAETLLAAGFGFRDPVSLGVQQARINKPALRTARVLTLLSLLVLAISLFGVWVAARLATQRRRSELALRRAVGATRRRLTIQLSAESLRTALLGSLLGAWLGTFVLNMAAEVLAVPAAGAAAMLLAVAFLHVLSATAATLPVAWTVSGLQPAEALHED